MSFRYFSDNTIAFPEVESIAREVSSNAIRSIPSTGEHKIYGITRDENQDWALEWESIAAL